MVGSIAVAAELAADDGKLLHAGGEVGLGHVEELENVVVAGAVHMVGIGAGSGDDVAAVSLRGDRFELGEDLFFLGIAVCGVALVDFETDDLGGFVVGGIVKFQFCAFLCCERAGHQHRDDHRESQQTAQGSLHHFSHSFFLLLKNCRHRNIMHKRKKIYPLIPVDNTDLDK